SAALIPNSLSSLTKCSPGCIAVSPMTVLLMIINDFNITGAERSSRPFKADPPLIVDADALLSFAVAFQSSSNLWPCWMAHWPIALPSGCSGNARPKKSTPSRLREIGDGQVEHQIAVHLRVDSKWLRGLSLADRLHCSAGAMIQA